MLKMIALAACASLILPCSAIAANFRWTVNTIAGKKQLIGMEHIPGDDGIDSLFRITCAAGGKIELGIGANVSVGKGKNEPVALTAVSGSTVVKVEGRSKESMNVEMTGTSELVKETGWDDPVLQLLMQSTPVAFRGVGVRRFIVPTTGFNAQLERFKRSCGRSS
jgi:hypothetical protein